MNEYKKLAVSWDEFNNNYTSSSDYRIWSYEPEGLILEKMPKSSGLEDSVLDSEMVS